MIERLRIRRFCYVCDMESDHLQTKRFANIFWCESCNVLKMIQPTERDLQEAPNYDVHLDQPSKLR